MNENILIIDNDHKNRTLLSENLKPLYQIFETANSREAFSILNRERIGVVLLDLHLPPVIGDISEGLKIFDFILNIHKEDCFVIVMTNDRKRETVYQALQRGAYDYFEKPVCINDLKLMLARAFHMLNLKLENQKLLFELKNKYEIEHIVGQSPAIQNIKQLIRILAETCAPVLITGESGTGKDIVAKAIHHSNLRGNRPFIVVNAGAIPENLLESELFGYEKGAFTGAVNSKPGKFELANGGTLFLDEIGDMPMYLQAKILRAIENHEIERLGGTKMISLNVRIIAATNKDIQSLIKHEQFREDLYYRLNVVKIDLSPLRKRPEDIPLIANHFLKRYTSREHKNITSFSAYVLEILKTYPWPGNIRELENVIERAVILCTDQEIEIKHLPDEIIGIDNMEYQTNQNLTDAVQKFKKQFILRVLRETGYDKAETVRRLGLNRTYFYRISKELGIKFPASK